MNLVDTFLILSYFCTVTGLDTKKRGKSI